MTSGSSGSAGAPASSTGAARSRRALIGGLAAGTGLLIVLLNWLGSTAVPVTQEQLQKAIDARLVRAIRVVPGGVEASLARGVRVHSAGRDVPAEQVRVQLPEAPDSTDLAEWERRGIRVSVADPREARWRETAGVVVLVLLLSTAVWHLWSQVREDRRHGSPRRRLRDLEMSYAAGEISAEEYQQRAQAIWAEM